MSRRLIVRPKAEADIAEAALWYDEREAGLGLELMIEFAPPSDARLKTRCII